MEQIFLDEPEVTREDIARLGKMGYTSHWNKINDALNDNPPDVDDLKRLIIIELHRDEPRPPIINKFIVRLQKKEREHLIERIMMTPGGIRALKSKGSF